jgi:septum formation protein
MTFETLITLGRKRPLVLGSRSPRRIQLLEELGVTFRRAVSQVDEIQRPGEDPYACAVRLAQEKAADVAAHSSPEEIVIGGDTIVVLDGVILGKPTDRLHAIETLRKLAGKQHTVCTALALADRERIICSGEERTAVYFHPVSADQIEVYVDGGEPMDKAGAYGIQGMGAFLVDRIEGNLDNVVGLPRTLLNSLAGDAIHLL